MKKIIQIFPKEITLPLAGILDKGEKEFLEEVRLKAEEEFGIRSRQYKTIIKGINFEKVTGSQFFLLLT